MNETTDQFPRLLDQARRVPLDEREAWIAALVVGPALKERLERALKEDVTVDIRAPVGLAPDLGVNVTRGATLSEPDQPGSRASGSLPATGGTCKTGGMDPMLGRTFAGVVIERILGSGGMGRVYLGKDGPDGPLVALKVLLRTQRDDNVRKRFDREARLLKVLRHPCIASVLRTGVEEDGDVDIPYIVMEYVEGVLSITDYVFKQRLGVRECAQLYLQVCDAVGFAHAQGYMHRDIKPANILVNRQGQVKVIDFGVARAVAVDSAAVTVRTETGQLVGTMQYMSPEQFKADPRLIDKRSDVYALAAVFYELITGIQPFDLRGMPVHQAARIVCETDPPDVRQCNPHIDQTLAELLAVGLSRDQTLRPDDAQAFGRRLKAWLSVPAPAIEPTIHPVHPDMLLNRATLVTSSHRVASPGKKSSKGAAKARRASNAGARGGWGGVVLVTLLVVVGVLLAFDIVPVRAVVEKVRALTNSVSSAAAADPDATDTKPSVAAVAGALRVEQIRVITAPPGAEVRLNGESRGLSPAVVLAEFMPRGVLQFNATKEGWQPATAQWASGKDSPLVVFNLVPQSDVQELQRAFVLDVGTLPKGATLTVTSPTQQNLKAGADAVLVDFKKVKEQWQSVPITFQAKDASGKPLSIQIGARRGVGTVSYDVLPEDVRNKLRIKVS